MSLPGNGAADTHCGTAGDLPLPKKNEDADFMQEEAVTT